MTRKEYNLYKFIMPIVKLLPKDVLKELFLCTLIRAYLDLNQQEVETAVIVALKITVNIDEK